VVSLQELGYSKTAGDEVEDLAVLAFAKERFPVGALFKQ
jgi:hypothetical protein